MSLKTALNRYFKGDKVLLLLMVFLSTISCLAIASVSNRIGEQVLYIGLSFGSMFLFYCIDYRFLSRFAYIGLIVALGVLLLTLFHGNNSRALQIFGLNVLTFYPIGFLVVFAVAKFMAQQLNQEASLTPKHVIVILVVMLLFCGLMYRANASTALMLALSCFVVLYVGNLKVKYLLYMGGIVLLCGTVLFLTGVGKSGTVNSRFEKFVYARDPFQVPPSQEVAEYNAQAILSQAAIAQSALLPTGPGKGMVNKKLPKKNNDYVYAAVVEEVGIVLGILLIFFYWMIFYRAMKIAQHSEGFFGRLLSAGIGFWIACQGLVHIAVNCVLFPATGQTLPMISTGGVSLITSGAILGVLLNISKRNVPQKENHAR
ncbi:MAG: FtsW/RodA/SpoVE family cell cycle protein [Bacteroidales bacterium]|jgi:cell division protein FtsW|nr:FtsW/RodA/SpoVE family cell cycle protein [Bacteroidales bacterium]